MSLDNFFWGLRCDLRCDRGLAFNEVSSNLHATIERKSSFAIDCLLHVVLGNCLAELFISSGEEINFAIPKRSDFEAARDLCVLIRHWPIFESIGSEQLEFPNHHQFQNS